MGRHSAIVAAIARSMTLRFADLADRLRQWRQAGTSLLYPPQCLQCDAELPAEASMLLCDACQGRLATTHWEGCPRCAARTARVTWTPSGCPLCRRRECHFDGVVVLGGYQDSLREAILRTKRPGGESWADNLARLLARRRPAELTAFAPDAIVPVPMHWRRRLLRRMDGPQVLAERLGRELGVACAVRALRRRRPTRLQRDLTPDQRALNVRGAFAPGGADLAGARVAAVDDIMTTGATANEVAKTLKRGGAAAVLMVVAARADGNEPGAQEPR